MKGKQMDKIGAGGPRSASLLLLLAEALNRKSCMHLRWGQGCRLRLRLWLRLWLRYATAVPEMRYGAELRSL